MAAGITNNHFSTFNFYLITPYVIGPVYQFGQYYASYNF